MIPGVGRRGLSNRIRDPIKGGSLMKSSQHGSPANAMLKRPFQCFPFGESGEKYIKWRFEIIPHKPVPGVLLTGIEKLVSCLLFYHTYQVS